MGILTTERELQWLQKEPEVWSVPCVPGTYKYGEQIGVELDGPEKYFKHVTGSNVVKPFGFALESLVVTQLGEELKVGTGITWVDNSSVNTVSGSHVNSIGWSEIDSNTHTVGTSGVNRQPLGRIFVVDHTNNRVAVGIGPQFGAVSGSF